MNRKSTKTSKNKDKTLRELKRDSKSFEAIQQCFILLLLNINGYSIKFKKPERRSQKTIQLLTVETLIHNNEIIEFRQQNELKCNETVQRELIENKFFALSPLNIESTTAITKLNLEHDQVEKLKQIKRHKDANMSSLSFNKLFDLCQKLQFEFKKRATKPSKLTIQMYKIQECYQKIKNSNGTIVHSFNQQAIETIGKEVNNIIFKRFDDVDQFLLIDGNDSEFVSLYNSFENGNLLNEIKNEQNVDLNSGSEISEKSVRNVINTNNNIVPVNNIINDAHSVSNISAMNNLIPINNVNQMNLNQINNFNNFTNVNQFDTFSNIMNNQPNDNDEDNKEIKKEESILTGRSHLSRFDNKSIEQLIDQGSTYSLSVCQCPSVSNQSIHFQNVQNQYQHDQYQPEQFQPTQYQTTQYQTTQFQTTQFQPEQYQSTQYQSNQYQPEQYQTTQYQNGFIQNEVTQYDINGQREIINNNNYNQYVMPEMNVQIRPVQMYYQYDENNGCGFINNTTD